MILCAIVAVSENSVIGKQGGLPWRISEDLRYFKELTTGKIIIMGRKTYESLGRPLPNRTHFILSRQKQDVPATCFLFSSLDEALTEARARARESEEVFVIGGGEIYREALPQVQRLYLTRVHKEIEGDTYFPKVDLQNDFRVVSERRSSQNEPEVLEYSFVVAERYSFAQ